MYLRSRENQKLRKDVERENRETLTCLYKTLLHLSMKQEAILYKTPHTKKDYPLESFCKEFSLSSRHFLFESQSKEILSYQRLFFT